MADNQTNASWCPIIMARSVDMIMTARTGKNYVYLKARVWSIFPWVLPWQFCWSNHTSTHPPAVTLTGANAGIYFGLGAFPFISFIILKRIFKNTGKKGTPLYTPVSAPNRKWSSFVDIVAYRGDICIQKGCPLFHWISWMQKIKVLNQNMRKI